MNWRDTFEVSFSSNTHEIILVGPNTYPCLVSLSRRINHSLGVQVKQVASNLHKDVLARGSHDGNRTLILPAVDFVVDRSTSISFFLRDHLADVLDNELILGHKLVHEKPPASCAQIRAAHSNMLLSA